MNKINNKWLKVLVGYISFTKPTQEYQSNLAAWYPGTSHALVQALLTN